MTVRRRGTARIAAVFIARDPARTRLTSALAVSIGVLGSALLASTLVSAVHTDKALLAMAVFFSLQAGNAVKDRRALGRLITTALLLPAVVVATLLAAALSAYRPALIVLFILITGAAIWVRRFGPRAAAIGMLSFISYFFALFMHTTLADAAAACAVAVIAVGTQLVMRAVLLVTRPRHQITVLLRELRSASAIAVHGATESDSPRMLRDTLARIDDVGRAIRTWQRTYSTSRYVSCQEGELESLALDARVDTQEACYECARLRRATPHTVFAELTAMRSALGVVLDEYSTRAAIAEAVATARDDTAVPDGPSRLSVVLLARAVLAHARLRAHARPLRSSASARRPVLAAAAPAPLPSPAASATSGTINRAGRHTAWRPSDRMAVQAMVAAAIAAGVGELLSASRWYWAVMTAFVVFIGASTRSGILTRAYRRVLGTAVGIGIGLGAVTLAHDDARVLVAIGVVAVFGMLYFGPLNYLYSALFMTIMLVSLYAMLGVLSPGVLDLRLTETFAGAVIGVLSAYLIVSANSQPALTSQVRAYFDALDALLSDVATSFSAAAPPTNLRTALDALEARQADLDAAIGAMSTAFLFSGHRRESEAVHLMYVVTRSAARITQDAQDDDSSTNDGDLASVRSAIDEVRTAAAAARQTLSAPRAAHSSSVAASAVAEHLADVRSQTPTRASVALLALLRMEWALHEVVDLWGATDDAASDS